MFLRFQFVAFFNVCVSLQVLQMEAPAFVKSGQDLVMQCNFDLEGENLYSIKWFLGKWEIFSYISSLSGEGLSTVSSSIPGIHITNSTMDPSSYSRLVLGQVTSASSGDYQCQVSGDGPRFLSDFDTKLVTVAVLPSSEPQISGLPVSCSPGDFLSLNCSVYNASLSLHLQWELNGYPVTDIGMLRHYRVKEEEGSGHQSTSLGLQIWVAKKHFRDGKMVVCCRASLPGIYNKTSASYVVGRFTEPLQSLETKSSSCRVMVAHVSLGLMVASALVL